MIEIKDKLERLNTYFAIENYLPLSLWKKRKFKREFIRNLYELQKEYTLKVMTIDDMLSLDSSLGIMPIRIFARQLELEQEKVDFKTNEISIIRKRILSAVFGEGVIFYFIDFSTIGIDPGYLSLVLTRNDRRKNLSQLVR